MEFEHNTALNSIEQIEEAIRQLSVDRGDKFDNAKLMEYIHDELGKAAANTAEGDDPSPLIFLAGPGGAVALAANIFLASEATKKLMNLVVKNITKRFPQISMVALCCATWSTVYKANKAGDGPDLNHPGERKEQYLVLIETREGPTFTRMYDTIREKGTHPRYEKYVENATLFPSRGNLGNFFNHTQREGDVAYGKA